MQFPVILLCNKYTKSIKPEKILFYIYGIMYSSYYRNLYKQFLKTDYPKIPFTKDEGIFNTISKYGEELIKIHTLKSKKLNNLISKLSSGNSIVGKTKSVARNYNPNERRVYINSEKQYFDGIKPEIWDYQIGGYQVLDSWLKYRMGKALNFKDIQHFCKTVIALDITIKIQKKIEKIYPEVENNLINFEI